jgi:hypothetical protein
MSTLLGPPSTGTSGTVPDDAPALAAAPVRAPGGGPGRFGLVLGILTALPLVAVGVALGAQHWVPTGDDAMIAWRSLDVFSLHPPLVGEYSQVGNAQQAFYPGPLEFWAIAIPLRIFANGFGAVVGTLAVAVVASVVALVAVARSVGRLAATLVALGWLLGTWGAAVAISNPVWNPDAPLVPFAAVLVLAWVVANGSLWWWPVAIALASYCVQDHLIYGPAVILVCLLAPVAGVGLRRPPRVARADAGWLATGLGTVVILWAAPVYQQLTTHPGNLSLLWAGTVGSRQPTLGWWGGLNLLARGLGPRPAWLGSPHPMPNGLVLEFTTGRQLWTIAAIVLLLVIGALATWRRQKDVLTLSLVALAAIIGGAWALGGTPIAKTLTLTYTEWIIWPIGMFAWFAVCWGGVRLLRLRSREIVRRCTTRIGRSGPRAAALVVAVAALAVSVALAASVSEWEAQDSYSPLSNGAAAVGISELVVRSDVPPVRLRLEGGPGDPSYQSYLLLMSLAYQLAQRGRAPTLDAALWHTTGADAARSSDAALEVAAAPIAAAPGKHLLGQVTVHDPDGTPHHWYVAYIAPGDR